MNVKDQIRRHCMETRKKIGEDYIKKRSDIIMSSLLSSDDYKNSESIFTYIAMPCEIDTNLLIQNAFIDNKCLLSPVLISKNEMAAAIVHKDTVFIKNKYNIDEPADNIFYYDNIDIIITPGLCFDESGNRIGYGGGFFDRFFEKHMNSMKIGVCLDEFIRNDIMPDRYDIRVDKIMTQSRIINIKR